MSLITKYFVTINNGFPRIKATALFADVTTNWQHSIETLSHIIKSMNAIEINDTLELIANIFNDRITRYYYVITLIRMFG